MDEIFAKLRVLFPAIIPKDTWDRPIASAKSMLSSKGLVDAVVTATLDAKYIFESDVRLRAPVLPVGVQAIPPETRFLPAYFDLLSSTDALKKRAKDREEKAKAFQVKIENAIHAENVRRKLEYNEYVDSRNVAKALKKAGEKVVVPPKRDPPQPATALDLPDELRHPSMRGENMRTHIKENYHSIFS